LRTAELLAKLGVIGHFFLNCDALLFYQQLTLPLGDPWKNKLEGALKDPRIPFFSEVEKFTNKYAPGHEPRRLYGHLFFQVSNISELWQFDMILIYDGVRGGS
jgi:hypothetical protein